MSFLITLRLIKTLKNYYIKMNFYCKCFLFLYELNENHFNNKRLHLHIKFNVLKFGNS